MKKILKIGVWVLLVAAPASFSSFAETYPDLRIPTALNEIPRPDLNPPAASPQEAPQQQAALPQNMEQQPAFDPAPAPAALPENQPDALAMQQQPAQNPQAVPTETPNLQAAAAPESAPAYQPQAPMETVGQTPEASPEVSPDYSGIASYYGDQFQGRPTASGEVFDMNQLTAAHRTLPFGSVVEVTNLNNGRTVQVLINDRGPFIKNRVIDLSYKAADTIDMIPAGIAPVNLRVISMGTGEFAVPQAQPALTAAAPPVAEPAPVLEEAPLREIAIQENVPGNKIQVVSFSVKQSALKTADFLASRGFSTVIEQARPFGQTVYRVIIPIESVQAATDIRRALGDAGFTDVLLRRS